MALPNNTEAMEQALCGELLQALAPLGFRRVSRDPRGDAWDSLLRTHPRGTQYLRPFVWMRDDEDPAAGFTCDWWLEVRDERVEQVLRKLTPHEANRPNALLKFSGLAGASDLIVDSPAALKAFVAAARSRLSDLLPSTEDMARLDALVNGDREEPDFFAELVSYAPLVIAYLGRNPRFDEMVMRADQRVAAEPVDVVSPPIRIAVFLRTRVKPD